MNILIAGGSGEVGGYLARSLSRKGHSVVILDRAGTEAVPGATLIKGDLADADIVRSALKGCDTVIHLAWSFADNPGTIFKEDIGGHINLLDAAVSGRITKFIYASTATVYGRAMMHPVTEAHPCLIGEARKPLYALGKYTAEELCNYYHSAKKLNTTIFRFWWAFGDTIGGSNLRDLITKALADQPLELVREAGGAFLTMDDLDRATMLAVSRPAATGQTYNLGSLFLTWAEIVSIIVRLTDSRSPIRYVKSEEWSGPRFLNEEWDLSWSKAKIELGFEPALGREVMLARFAEALKATISRVRQDRAKQQNI